MDNQNLQGDPTSTQDPPPYSEKQPYDQQPPRADGAMPTQSQPYYAPYGAAPGQAAIVQPLQHTTFIAPIQPTHEPDYLAYSILTMIFCCLPLGIAALVFSIQTRDANRTGNGIAAKRNSRMARILASSALGVGLVLIIVYIVLVVMASNLAY